MNAREFLEETDYDHSTKAGTIRLMEEYFKYKIDRYNKFLLKEGYTDTDIISEEPTAIDQFLNRDHLNR